VAPIAAAADLMPLHVGVPGPGAVSQSIHRNTCGARASIRDVGSDAPPPPEVEDAEWLRRLLGATDLLLHRLEAMVERGQKQIGDRALRELTVVAAFLPEPWPVRISAKTPPHQAIEELFAIQDVLLTARVVKPADMVEFDEGVDGSRG